MVKMYLFIYGPLKHNYQVIIFRKNIHGLCVLQDTLTQHIHKSDQLIQVHRSHWWCPQPHWSTAANHVHSQRQPIMFPFICSFSSMKGNDNDAIKMLND